MRRMKMMEEKMEQKEKKGRKNNVIITGIGAISGNVERKKRKRAVGEGRLDEKDGNDRGKDGTKRKEGEEE
jgi:hypothetical protein